MTDSPVKSNSKDVTSSKVELSMVIYPDPSLKDKVNPVSEEIAKDPHFRQCIGTLIRTMYQYAGIGLAANQIGIPMAAFVLDTRWPTFGRRKPRVFINPVVEEYKESVISLNPPGEGCLSCPYGFRAQVKRSEGVRISWYDLDWNQHEEWFTGVEAIAVQHEIDHLHGFLFVDRPRISRLKRDIFERKVKKQRRHYANGIKRVQSEVKKMALVESK